MNVFSKSVLRLLFVTAGNLLLAAPSNEMKTWKTFLVEIPNFVVEYKIPPTLKLGYGGFRTKISFGIPGKDKYAFSFGDGAREKSLGTFFLGIVGDFRDWDLRTEFFVIKFDRSQRPMRSVEELAEFARGILSEKYVLVDGKEFSELGGAMIEKMGSYDVVVATSTDQYHVRTVKLKGGGEPTLAPYQFYYIRLDDEMTIGIRVFHDKEKRLTPKWHADSRALIAAIIENIRAKPTGQAGQANGVDGKTTGSGLQK